ncbi:MAG: AAA family ATPase [Actinomycetota bacterium]
MTSSRRVVAVGGSNTFPPEVARALGESPDAVSWLPSIASAQMALADGKESFDVVVLAPSVGDDEAIALAEFAARESPATAVLVVRDAPVDGAFPRLVRGGVRDVVDLTKGRSEFKDALHRALEWSSGMRGSANGNGSHGPTGVIVSVFSTKGGTGKTFLSCNLAAALAERSGSRVALVDLDHDLGDVFASFRVEPSRTLQELLTLDEGADVETIAQLGTPLVKGVTGFGSRPDPRAEPIPGAAIARMLSALKEAFPFTVVDATSEYADHVLAALDLSDTVCLITGLDAIGVRHMTIAMQTLQSLGVPRDRLRFVVNRADSKVDLTIEDIERLVGVRIDGRIPSSPLVPRSVNRGRILWADQRRSDVAKGIEAFADLLRGTLAPQAVPVAANGHRRWGRG